MNVLSPLTRESISQAAAGSIREFGFSASSGMPPEVVVRRLALSTSIFDEDIGFIKGRDSSGAIYEEVLSAIAQLRAANSAPDPARTRPLEGGWILYSVPNRWAMVFRVWQGAIQLCRVATLERSPEASRRIYDEADLC
jgi:hypothetical protein